MRTQWTTKGNRNAGGWNPQKNPPPR